MKYFVIIVYYDTSLITYKKHFGFRARRACEEFYEGVSATKFLINEMRLRRSCQIHLFM
jgi:hypothetical protein